MKKAFAYFRAPSASNVGDDKDSLLRQRAACEAYAARAGVEIVTPLSLAPTLWSFVRASSGCWSASLGNGVRTIIVDGVGCVFTKWMLPKPLPDFYRS